jgi:DNA-binding MarR family transcriptional regulator
MPSTLENEIKQTRPFANLREETAVNLRRSSSAWEVTFDRLLEPYDITGTQYNVLRILRGAGPDGLCRQEIRDRLVHRMPDATRLLDRMEDAGLITRRRSDVDRRMVNTALTEKGRTLVDSLDGPVSTIHAEKSAHMSDAQLHTLNELLTLFRERLG